MSVPNPFVYHAEVYDVYDADTIKAIVDLGFKTQQKLTFRLYGIDAPEVRGEERPEGLVARDWLRERILAQPVVIETHRDRQGKFGRWLATVWHKGININHYLVDMGLARTVEY